MPFNKELSLNRVDAHASQIKDLIFNNIKQFGFVHNKQLSNVSIDKLQKQNIYSSRFGGKLTLEFDDHGKMVKKNLWIKRVELPRQTYEAMASVYNKLKKDHIVAPFPKPYLYDEELRVVIMEMVNGTNLFKLTLAYLLSPGERLSSPIPKQFYKIGRWLQKYHRATQTDRTIKTKHQILNLINYIYVYPHLTPTQRKVFIDHLSKIANEKIAVTEFVEIIPHNDFTLRNIFVSKDLQFATIDWDAMIHPQFPARTWCWSDLTTLFLNIQSLLRFYPLVGKHKIMRLSSSLLKGYFHNNRFIEGVTVDDFMKTILYIQALNFFVGMECDRPLSQIYSKRLTWRYINLLKKNLLRGKAYI